MMRVFFRFSLYNFHYVEYIDDLTVLIKLKAIVTGPNIYLHTFRNCFFVPRYSTSIYVFII